MKIGLVGAPVQSGASQPGCIMGPDAFHTAGLAGALESLGHSVVDFGNSRPERVCGRKSANPAVRNLDETVGWAVALEDQAHHACHSADVPIFLGGDHSLSIGTVPGVARYSDEQDRPQFVLWLDAHPDFHCLNSTGSGNLHGTPVAYFTGQDGFEDIYPKLNVSVPQENVCMMGIRSVDQFEKQALAQRSISVFDMRALDEHGVVAPLKQFLEKVKQAGGGIACQPGCRLSGTGDRPGCWHNRSRWSNLSGGSPDYGNAARQRIGDVA